MAALAPGAAIGLRFRSLSEGGRVTQFARRCGNRAIEH
jgi:hypothetical protein